MLSKSKRLTKIQFDEVFKKGRVQHSPLFVMRVIGDSKDVRLSAVSSKKVDNTAVKRNSTKRKIYKATSLMFGKVKKPVWAILFAKRSLKDSTVEEIEKDIQTVFVKSGILE